MVYYANLTEVNDAFSRMVGSYNHSDVAHHPDNEEAFQLAALKPGNTVLELGAGGGRLIADAKVAVGAGFCVAVDGVQGFLNVDIPSALADKGLAAYPNGTPAQQVHLLRANVTDGALVANIRALPGAPQTFDRIFAIHLFTTIPAHQRRQLLRTLRTLLAPTGRLVVNMSARFTDTAPLPAEANVPAHFRTTPHTEAPGATILCALQQHSFRTIASGASLPEKRVVAAVQFAPDRLWQVAAQQATAAAVDAGFTVHTVRNIGNGNQFGLAQGAHSPPQAALRHMSYSDTLRAARQAPVGHYSCSGRALQAACRLDTMGWDQMTPSDRDCRLACWLQTVEASHRQNTAQANAHLPAGGVLYRMSETSQVGVLLVLCKR